MFGYVMPRMEDLSQEERERYHAAYCGVCRALGERCGQRCRVALTYDMTFLALLLGSLYEPDERQGSRRCAPHPVRPHAYLGSDCIDYAADMTVALVYHKCLDDWRDDRSGWARAYASLLGKAYRAVGERHPRACAAIEEGLADIGRLEEAAAAAASAGDAAASPPPDAAANRFGALLGEVFAWRDDFWAAGLRSLGAKLGKLVYVMDAALDMEDDRASGSYNPLVALDAQPQEVREDLKLLAADAAAAFERLPLERDVRVLRSVLYAGVWQKYCAKETKHVQEEHQEAHRG
ncbi:hypothetical protein B5F44_03525 [Gordonibacter urolithinfaciens]|uniref:DUF5685 family protein n=1 Tax=Gordonibacter urolithinfaciens TaxID=1335613 RepID=UPI000B3A2496|nr:DUF5685 family protein [Gordonibacter urolithinfaciens]OUO88536.1 hypothetical protein B5F44_03525 [Gordonibacter urolithinfaciens]